MDQCNEYALEIINRLLERLHQADFSQHGNHYQFVYVASGGQHINTIQTQNIAYPNPPKGREKEMGEVPEALGTAEAMVLWRKAQDAGWIDAHYQPLVSRTQAALLANAMAERLGIKEKWKVFETLWNRKNIYRDYYKALNLQQSLTFQDEIKRVFL